MPSKRVETIRPFHTSTTRVEPSQNITRSTLNTKAIEQNGNIKQTEHQANMSNEHAEKACRNDTSNQLLEIARPNDPSATRVEQPSQSNHLKNVERPRQNKHVQSPTYSGIHGAHQPKEKTRQATYAEKTMSTQHVDH